MDRRGRRMRPRAAKSPDLGCGRMGSSKTAASCVANIFHGPEKCLNLGASLSVGDDDANPSKKICPCPGTHWACDGRSGERIVCWRPCGVKHRSVHVRGFYSHDDDWWRSWVLPGNRYSASGFSCTKWSAFKKRPPVARSILQNSSAP